MFYSPDVSLGNEWSNNPVLYFGTGDRSHPRLSMISNRFYVVSDTDSLIDETDLLNLTCDELDDETDLDGDSDHDDDDEALQNALKTLLFDGTAKGFFRVLDKQGDCAGDPTDHSGEMVLSQPSIFADNVYFTSYQPVFDEPCNPTGNAFIYALDYSFGTAGLNFDIVDEYDTEGTNIKDTYQKISGSSIPSGVRIITRGGTAAGLISAGGSISGVGEEQTTKIPGPPGGVTQILWETE
jgi:type IV pilus assembly protein PilY1